MIGGLAAVCGFLAVALGAFGAHGLDGRMTTDQTAWWETATLYLLVHAGVVFAVSRCGTATVSLPGALMLSGAVIFAATLYAMGLGAPTHLGAITPIGGVLMLTGWALFAASALRQSSG